MINEFVLSNWEAENLHAHHIAHPDPTLLVDAHALQPRELARLDRLPTHTIVVCVSATLAERGDELAVRCVDLDTSVATVSDHHVALAVETQSSRIAKLFRSISECAELVLEVSSQIEHLITKHCSEA